MNRYYKTHTPHWRAKPIVKSQRNWILLSTTTLFLSFGSLVHSAFAQDSITVYTVSQHPVSIPSAQQSITRLITLDRILQVEDILAFGLETLDEQQRLSVTQSRLTDSHRRELILAWQGLIRIRNQEIKFLPAIVLNQQAVWYGTNVRRALSAWQSQSKKGRQNEPL